MAVIGTGCTGYQMIPELALEAAHVTVFQRTPQWLFPVPGYRSPFPPQVNWLDRNLPFHTNFMRARACTLDGHRRRRARSIRTSTIRTPAARSTSGRAMRASSSWSASSAIRRWWRP